MENSAKAGENRFVYLTAAVSALRGMLFGYDIGVISGAILFMKTDFSLSPVMEASLSAQSCWDRSPARQSGTRQGELFVSLAKLPELPAEVRQKMARLLARMLNEHWLHCPAAATREAGDE